MSSSTVRLMYPRLYTWRYDFIFSAANSFILTFLKLLNLFCSFSFQSCMYDLYAVVNHFGNIMGGHYVAQIKSFETGVWYQFDDNTVKIVSQVSILLAV